MAQSNTITRFVAREVGIAGKNNMEMAQCDLIAEFCSEVTEGKTVISIIKCKNTFDIMLILSCDFNSSILQCQKCHGGKQGEVQGQARQLHQEHGEAP